MLTVNRDNDSTMPPRKETEAEREQRLANLKPFSAPDTAGGTVMIGGKVPPELKEWLTQFSKASGKTSSQVIREALEMYRAAVSAAPPEEPAAEVAPAEPEKKRRGRGSVKNK